MAVRGPKPLVAGNWKMNGTSQALREVRLLAGMLKGVKLRCDVAICPPFTLIPSVRMLLKGSRIRVGGQDCHAEAGGAHTGDISAEMLKDQGCAVTIVGHSERRAAYRETDADVAAKASAAHRAGLAVIVCVGETLDERKSGKALSVVSAQVDASIPQSADASNTIVAYEPVWAIGTGLTPSEAEIAEMHGGLRTTLSKRHGSVQGRGMAILYGGSVKPANAQAILGVENVDGALVGGASLKAADFIGIIKAYA